jgi:hypothetical protein
MKNPQKLIPVNSNTILMFLAIIFWKNYPISAAADSVQLTLPFDSNQNAIHAASRAMTTFEQIKLVFKHCALAASVTSDGSLYLAALRAQLRCCGPRAANQPYVRWACVFLPAVGSSGCRSGARAVRPSRPFLYSLGTASLLWKSGSGRRDG